MNSFCNIDSRKINFVISIFGLLGSLYFSEILKFPPCSLCWYQRIALYPLPAIYAVALWFDDRNHFRYVIPFIAIGFAISLYHNLLYYGVIEQAIIPCAEGGVTCTARQLELFGFLTIPLLAFLSFVAMGFVETVNFKLNRLRGDSLEK